MIPIYTLPKTPSSHEKNCQAQNENRIFQAVPSTPIFQDNLGCAHWTCHPCWRLWKCFLKGWPRRPASVAGGVRRFKEFGRYTDLDLDFLEGLEMYDDLFRSRMSPNISYVENKVNYHETTGTSSKSLCSSFPASYIIISPCFFHIPHPRKTNMSPKKGTISIGNTSSNHWIFKEHVRFAGGVWTLQAFQKITWQLLGVSSKTHLCTCLGQQFILAKLGFT